MSEGETEGRCRFSVAFQQVRRLQPVRRAALCTHSHGPKCFRLLPRRQATRTTRTTTSSRTWSSLCGTTSSCCASLPCEWELLGVPPCLGGRHAPHY